MTQPIEIYTDGSCHTQLKTGAWASIVLFPNEKIVLKGEETNTTHHRMEILAVIKTIKFLDERQFAGQLIVYTDSQYVCGIPNRMKKLKQNRFITSKGNLLQNADLVQIFIQQIESHTIRFVKVKSHQHSFDDISRYNGEVDTLSREIVRENVKRG